MEESASVDSSLLACYAMSTSK